MARFILAYHGGDQLDEHAGMALMGKWQQWIGGLGSSVIDPGAPLGPSKTVSTTGVTDNGGANPLCGITVLQASTLEAALAIAKTCPHLEINGTIEVAQVLELNT